eukprot:NODE_22_length_42145_cov_1.310612.p8 type:complete len:503 gc:universal NODE_22_length_42145_cov_1.310612:8936-7428(-)
MKIHHGVLFMKLISQAILFASGILAAQYGFINDCDETYNYWEPLHFLHYGKGFMTWEYDPRYAIRSYTYLLIFYFLTLAFKSEHDLFFLKARYILSLLNFASFYYFINICSKKFGSRDYEIIMVLLMSFSPGILVSTVALLPSSTCMTLVAVSYASLAQGKRFISLSCIVSMSAICWPFSGLLVVMQLVDLIYTKLRFLKVYLLYGIIQSIVVLSLSYAIDSYFYKKPVFAAWNIVKYNILSQHGPSLYGIEPMSYYLKVLILHWGPLAILIPFSIILSLLSFDRMRLISSIAIIIWLSVFFAQPHKEERFLYPIYPLLALEMCHIIYKVKQNSKQLYLILLSSFLLFSIFRITAIIPRRNTLSLFKNLPENSTVCLGDEWHLFPSSFNIPLSSDALFIQGNFDGQLPYKFENNSLDHNLKPSWLSASLEMKHVNDENVMSPGRTVDPQQCHYFYKFEDSLKDLCTRSLSPKENLFGRVLRFPWKPLKVEQYQCLIEKSLNG